MTSDDKRLFRATKCWKDFRKQLLKDRGNRCEICGSKAGGLNIHHIDEDNYTDLNPDLFIIMCKTDHRNLHRLMRRKEFDIDEYIVAFKNAYKKSFRKTCTNPATVAR